MSGVREEPNRSSSRRRFLKKPITHKLAWLVRPPLTLHVARYGAAFEGLFAGAEVGPAVRLTRGSAVRLGRPIQSSSDVPPSERTTGCRSDRHIATTRE